MTQPKIGHRKSVSYRSDLTKDVASAHFLYILTGLVAQGVTHKERKDELLFMIEDVAKRASRFKDSRDVKVREDIVKISQIPGTMNISIDLMYYEIKSDSYKSEEMSIKFATGLHRIEHASLALEGGAHTILNELIESSLEGIDVPEEARTLIMTQANDRLGETLEALIVPPEYQEEVKQPASPPLTGKVNYGSNKTIDLATIDSPKSMVNATQDIQNFSRLFIDKLAGSQ